MNKVFQYTTPLLLGLLLLSGAGCTHGHDEMLQAFEELKAGSQENYPAAYAYCTYLSTSKKISADEALPLVLELIAWDYHSEARYCIDNMDANGIASPELLALKGLCLHNELQTDAAMDLLQEALAGDPANEKIKGIITAINRGERDGQATPHAASPSSLEQASGLISAKEYGKAERILNQVLQEDQSNHQALFYKGIIRLWHSQYDSALYYFTFARSSENLEEYNSWLGRTKGVIDAGKAISEKPGAYQGYLSKGQNLAAMGLYEAAQQCLSQGLEQVPGNMNLMLAKALVWVQAGQTDMARQYFLELEQRGISIDPALRDKILKQS